MGVHKKFGNPGEKYGRLTIIGEAEPKIEPSGQKHRMVLAQCSCGSDPFEVLLSNLRNGNTTSCGCVRKEKTKERMKKFNTYDLETYEYGVGYTTKGEEFYFDKEDYQKIKEYTWYLDKDGYVITYEANTGKQIKFHRLIMNCTEGMDIDHRFHKVNDNRKSQLRECTRSQNNMNHGIRKDNASSVTGVSWDKARNKWRAYITINGKTKHLGYFINKEDAIQSRLEAEIKYFGEFACTES